MSLVQSGRSIGEVCRDLDCSSWSMGRWGNEAEQGTTLTEPKTLKVETSEQRENRRLRDEVACLRRQRDIF